MSRAVSEKPVVGSKNLPFHARAPVLGRHEFPMVFSDEHHEAVGVNSESADQIPAVFFEAFSLGAVFGSNIH